MIKLEIVRNVDKIRNGEKCKCRVGKSHSEGSL